MRKHSWVRVFRLKRSLCLTQGHSAENIVFQPDERDSAVSKFPSRGRCWYFCATCRTLVSSRVNRRHVLHHMNCHCINNFLLFLSHGTALENVPANAAFDSRSQLVNSLVLCIQLKAKENFLNFKTVGCVHQVNKSSYWF